MNYHIEVKNSIKKWERIASFQYPQDRDDCVICFIDIYKDYKFRTIDEE